MVVSNERSSSLRFGLGRLKNPRFPQELSRLVQAPLPKRDIWTNHGEGDDSLGRGHQGSQSSAI